MVWQSHKESISGGLTPSKLDSLHALPSTPRVSFWRAPNWIKCLSRLPMPLANILKAKSGPLLPAPLKARKSNKRRVGKILEPKKCKELSKWNWFWPKTQAKLYLSSARVSLCVSKAKWSGVAPSSQLVFENVLSSRFCMHKGGPGVRPAKG